MSPHITAHDPVMSRKSRHPVIPELGATTDTMLEPYRLLFSDPRVGVVVDLVIHFAIVGSNFRHTLLLIALCAKCRVGPGSGVLRAPAKTQRPYRDYPVGPEYHNMCFSFPSCKGKSG